MRYRAELYQAYVSSGQVATRADGLPDLAPRAPYLRRLIAAHLPQDRNARILDLGCGHGAFLHFCRDAGYRNLEGVEVSAEQAAIARRLGLECVTEGDLAPFLGAAADGRFDVVMAFDVLEHFPRDEVMALLRQIARVLGPGGRLILHVPNGESPFAGAVLYGDFTHELAFTRQSIAQIGRVAGFSDISCHEDMPVAHGAVSLLRSGLWRCLRFGFHLVTAIETGDASRTAILSRNLLAVLVKTEGGAPAGKAS